jgi:hypothetical protein
MDELDAVRAFRTPLARPDAEAQARVAARIAREPGHRPSRVRRPRAVVILVILAATLIAVAISGAAGSVVSLVGVTDDDATPVPVSGGTSVPATGYVLGSELHDSAGNVYRLSVPAGPASSLADAQGSSSGEVVYVAGTTDQSLRLFDPATRSDSQIDASGTLPAWRQDGTLAYVQYPPGTGASKATLVVRSTPTAPPVTWATGPGYAPLAWAGDSLIVAQQLTGPAPDLLAFTSPGAARKLGSGALVAISPDGTQLLIADGASLDGIPSSPHLRIVELSSGKSVDTLDLGAVAPSGIDVGTIVPGGPGAWENGRIVFPAPAGVVVLSVTADGLALAQVASFTGDRGLRGAEYHEARFLDASGNRVIVKAVVLPPSGAGGQMLPSALTCDLTADSCTRGAVADDPTQPLTLIYNESRPTG